ncbi:MAG: SymE family type I addiction module toxin [Chloroflexota bacterium]
MDLRHFTVGYRPVDTRSQASWPQPAPSRMPFVRLSGRWLERAGFGIGTAVRVQVSRGRLVLEAIEPDRPGRPRARRMAGD